MHLITCAIQFAFFSIHSKQNMDAPMRLYKILFYGRNLCDYGQKYTSKTYNNDIF